MTDDQERRASQFWSLMERGLVYPIQTENNEKDG